MTLKTRKATGAILFLLALTAHYAPPFTDAGWPIALLVHLIALWFFFGDPGRIVKGRAVGVRALT